MKQEWRHIDNPSILLTRMNPEVDFYILVDEEERTVVDTGLRHEEVQFCNFIKQPGSDEIAE